MSATYPLRKPATAQPKRKAAAAARPRLVLISSPRRTVARGPFIVLVAALLIGGLLSLLMLHTLAAQDAFRQTTLQHRLAALNDTEQQLEQQVQTDSAPAALEARARALGMVPSTISSYHRRPDGRAVAHVVPLTPVVTAPDPTTSPTTDSNETDSNETDSNETDSNDTTAKSSDSHDSGDVTGSNSADSTKPTKAKPTHR